MLLVKLAAAPVDGAANDALIALLSTALDLPSRNIQIVSGHTNPRKEILILGLDSTTIESRLTE